MSSTFKADTNKKLVVGRGAIVILASVLAGTTAIPLHPSYAVTLGPPQHIVGFPEDAEPPQILASRKNVYIIWHERPLNDLQADVFISRSTNRGQNFGLGTNLSNTVDSISASEEIAASRRNVYVVWSEATTDIFFTRSTDEGASFEPAKKLSVTAGADVPRIAASGKNVYVAWQADVGGFPDIFFTQSSDGGSTFDPEINISNTVDLESEFRDAGLDQIAVSGRNVIVTWREQTAGTAINMAFEVFFVEGN